MKRKTRPGSRGSVFIETGIALAFMLMMIGGIIMIATQLNRYSKVTESLSQAARLGSTVSGLAEGGGEIACSSGEISSAVQSICVRAQRLLIENGVFPSSTAGAAQALAALSVSHTPLLGEDGKEITNRSVVSVRAQVPLFPIGSVSIGQINVRGASPYLVNESSLESGSSGSTGGGTSGSGLGGSSSGGLAGSTGGTGSTSGSGTFGSKGISGNGIKGGITLAGAPADVSSDDAVSDQDTEEPVPVPASDDNNTEDGLQGTKPPVIATSATAIPVDDSEDVPILPSPLPTAVPATVPPATATAVPATAVPATEAPADEGAPISGGGGGVPILATVTAMPIATSTLAPVDNS